MATMGAIGTVLISSLKWWVWDLCSINIDRVMTFFMTPSLVVFGSAVRLNSL